MTNFKQILLAASLSALSGIASATPIIGSINIGGASSVTNNGSVSTGISFGAASVNFAPAPTGSFAGFESFNTSASGGTGGLLTMSDFLYADIPSQVIWAIDTTNNGSTDISFTLDSITVVSGDTPNFAGLVLFGTGFFTDVASGDTTDGVWQFSQSGASFSSQTVPEPALALLLGTGLIGFGVARKLRKKA